MTNPKVWFCEINLENGARPTRKTLEQDENLDVIGYGCLKRCKRCDQQLFAVVDGTIIEADSSDALVESIYEHIGARSLP